MSRVAARVPTTGVALIGLGLILLLLAGCEEDSPPASNDTAQIPDSTIDQFSGWPDLTPDPDQPSLWPDTSPPSQPDSYAGAPFGCVDDRDCHGLQCCPTPWGVKLCAAGCR